ncbi:hypothetical protein ACVMB0_004609 [Bradyrhizobium sp. USDA 4451]
MNCAFSLGSLSAAARRSNCKACSIYSVSSFKRQRLASPRAPLEEPARGVDARLGGSSGRRKIVQEPRPGKQPSSSYRPPHGSGSGSTGQPIQPLLHRLRHVSSFQLVTCEQSAPIGKSRNHIEQQVGLAAVHKEMREPSSCLGLSSMFEFDHMNGGVYNFAGLAAGCRQRDLLSSSGDARHPSGAPRWGRFCGGDVDDKRAAK